MLNLHGLSECDAENDGHRRPKNRTTSAKTMTDDVAAIIASHVVPSSGCTLNTVPPNVTMSAWPNAVSAAIVRKVGFLKSPVSPLIFAVNDRQFTRFHTWK